MSELPKFTKADIGKFVRLPMYCLPGKGGVITQVGQSRVYVSEQRPHGVKKWRFLHSELRSVNP